MKRIFIILWIMLIGHCLLGQTMYYVEIYADGIAIPETDALRGEAAQTNPCISWKITNESNGTSIEVGVDKYLDWYADDVYGDGGSWLIVNLYRLEQKGALAKGTQLTLTLTITDKNHPLYGYTGSVTLINDNTGNQFFSAENGINLVKTN